MAYYLSILSNKKNKIGQSLNKKLIKEMRKTLIKAVLTLTFMICGLESFAQSTPTKNRWGNLIKAISVVESEENPKAVSGKHVGLLQISPIVVEDCNRINRLKKNPKRYKLNDRYSIEKSIEMFQIIQDYYNPSHNIEKAIRLWNGGSGYTISGTEKYYQKVKRNLEKIESAS